ncbi:hypothetical protein JCGZ_24255 [Jatropha curcas]|uniref:Uncharacterized protein n=1 Tax=Jatropha curcas TaxID=180498 RepID=A0A067JQP5_JATCU|nr:hypothetical protein JCGZ_24255 [Jatropha curcas]
MAFRNQVSSFVQSLPDDLWEIQPMNQLAWLKYFKDLKPDHGFLSWLVRHFNPNTMVFRFDDSEVTPTYEEMCTIMGHHPEQDETPALPPSPRYDLTEIAALCPVYLPGDEPGFSQAQIRTIAQIVAAALAQDRAQNQNTPSSSQPVVEERQIPDPVSDNQTSVGNTTPVENDALKQLAELKERFDKMVAVKEKDPVTNFHITDKTSANWDTLKIEKRKGRGSNLNHIFFVPQAEGKFQSRGKTYPGLEIFMTDYEKKLIKSPEPSLDQLVDGTEFIVCMTEASTESEWSKKISEFEDFLWIGDEASKLVQEQKAKARILQSVLAAEDAEEAERKVLKMKLAEEKVEATQEEEEGAVNPYPEYHSI